MYSWRRGNHSPFVLSDFAKQNCIEGREIVSSKQELTYPEEITH